MPASRQTFQALLVVAQASVAVVLLIVGGLLLRSLDRLNRVDLGIEPRPGLVVWLNMNLSRYPSDDDRTSNVMGSGWFRGAPSPSATTRVRRRSRS